MKRILLFIFIFPASIYLMAQEKMTTDQYIKKYSEWAIEEMERSGIPASITLAQGILESGSGNSRLARKGKNHFGIKCHSDWTGEKIYEDDDAKGECFRKYKNAYESFKDHSDFLMKHSRYSFLFNLPIEKYKAWAKGLQKAGYATNPKYAKILIGLIERHKLYEYDSKKSYSNELLASSDYRNNTEPGFTDNWVIDPYDRQVLENNNRPFIIARGGDNIISLAQEFDMMKWQFYKYNDMDKTDSIKRGQMVYLKPKRNKAETGAETHVVKEAETLWSISQKYGVKERKLRKKNNLSADDKVKVGDKLYLRENKDGSSFLGLF